MDMVSKPNTTTSSSSLYNNNIISNTNNTNNSSAIIVLKFKLKKDGPYEFVLDLIDNKIVIIDIFEGGIIHRHGGLRVGDEIQAVNNVDLKSYNFNDSLNILESVMDDTSSNYLELTISREISQIGSESDEEVTSL